VVLHSGEVKVETHGYEVWNYAVNYSVEGLLFEKYRDACLADRKRAAAVHFDLLLKSLDEIFTCAQKNKVRVGIENRMYLNEMPDMEEMGIIFERFKGAPAGLWYDAGHAHIMERMGAIASSLQYLELYGKSLIGCHLHDLRVLVDHYAPGSGDTDFSRLKPYINKDAWLIMEVHDKSGTQEVKKGLELLKTIQ
jgi:sugar phosphate isomerase/epimerase